MKKQKPSTEPKPLPVVPVELIFDPNVNALSAGFRVGWINGKSDKCEIDLSCGAGVGTPFMVFSRTDRKTGKTRYAVCDIRPMVKALAAAFDNG